MIAIVSTQTPILVECPCTLMLHCHSSLPFVVVFKNMIEAEHSQKPICVHYLSNAT